MPGRAPSACRPLLMSSAALERRPKFGGDAQFQTEVRRRVRAFLAATGRRERDVAAMYAKTVLLLAALAATWAALVFWAAAWWQAVPLAILLGFATAAIGFNVQHDGGHHAYSDRPWINRWMARTLDLVGGSSYYWHFKHGVFHHTYTNVHGHDDDVDLAFFGRLTPHHPRRGFHRWQHLYLWPLYGFLAVKWHLYDDFKCFATGRVGPHRVPRPRGAELAVFWLGKAAFLSWSLAIPLTQHSLGTVALFYAVASLFCGLVLSVVFQLAHVVEEAEFPLADGAELRLPQSWAAHQIETTVDFARRSRVASFLLGGLNFQVEHHLFPQICHVHYPAIAPVVEQACRDYGLRYRDHGSFWSGVASHYRLLRRLGRGEAAAA